MSFISTHTFIIIALSHARFYYSIGWHFAEFLSLLLLCLVTRRAGSSRSPITGKNDEDEDEEETLYGNYNVMEQGNVVCSFKAPWAEKEG